MVRGLGIDIAAEGVETAGQRRLLHELGRAPFQGYLACPPIDAESFGDLRARHTPLARPLGVDAVP